MRPDPQLADNTPDRGGSPSRSFGLIAAAEWIGLLVIATYVIAPATSTAALWTLLPGIGAALVLYATCGLLQRQSALLAAHNESG